MDIQRPNTDFAAPAVEEEQLRMLRDSAALFAAKHSGIQRLRSLHRTSVDFDKSIWAEMARIGWTGILLPEDAGGAELSMSAAAVVARELGRQLLPEPFVSVAVMALTALVECGDADVPRELANSILLGTKIIAVAGAEEAAGRRPLDARAIGDGPGWRIVGRHRSIRPATMVDGFIVPAKLDDALALFWVPSGIDGVLVEFATMADGSKTASIELDVQLPAGNLLAANAAAGNAIRSALTKATIACCSELVGTMQAALQMTLDYVRLRRQFGRPIGSFQALQHRLVDLHIQAQLATACVDDVLARHDGGDIDLFSISRMKSRCSEAALYITRQAIQLHGAIGYTEEHNIGLYLKRSIVLSAWLGTASEHRGLAAKFVSREWGVAS